MGRAVLGICAVAAVAASPQWVRADDSAELRRLRAENELLRAELAETRKQIAQLRAGLASVAKQMKRLEARLTDGQTKLSGTLDIRVEAGGWGGAGVGDIQKVLHSAASQLWKHRPGRRLAPVVVRHGGSGPITLFDRGPAGEHIVKLDVEGRFWCQFAYQFAHEFCHILANHSPKTSSKNQWFEEALAEAASLYAVAQMGETWKTSPPYPNWKGYAAALTKYARETRQKKGAELPAGTTLARWYRLNEAALRKNPYDRDKNRLVAKRLLGLLEKDPSHWAAIGYLNLSKADAGASFRDYLSSWHRGAPARHKAFIERIAGMFDIRLTGRAKAAAGPLPRAAGGSVSRLQAANLSPL